jgi:hypothetical protein
MHKLAVPREKKYVLKGFFGILYLEEALSILKGEEYEQINKFETDGSDSFKNPYLQKMVFFLIEDIV